ncbi:bifunctional tetrahydrofolate synthase/dihydrofolate synthase [Halomonas sp. ML-15]|uniref:bifunctional tetrahydrofolate synthase/dihydrofolate synthase n=1 Tax=Halomonas sp. ML-15 TaxID=2773305 RepID=UPI0017465D5B|nr:bifunctional tetrahydrofolate synthase/dihydrofolate synthase [Halomonas sp. ML-15]MBD3896160.1 bifunctional tetrahydrofolate synthase/dihydrofolate synthase [Halomonas sp. ML-15]
MSPPDSPSQPADLAGWLAYLERQHPLSIELGLERVAAVAERMGLFDAPVAGRLITVAGTNGKGSTVAVLDALARAHGLTTASYTSPHLLRYNERLRFDGAEADDATLIAGFAAVEAARLADEPISLTYFEVGTLAALHSIAQRSPQLAILEVGLGGRLDAVNILSADVAVVTTVAQDHAAFLGTDIAQIGREKAGIMRAGRPAVLGSSELPPSVRAYADELGVPLYALGEQMTRSEPDADGRWQWQGHITGQREGDSLTLDHLPDPGLPLDNAASALQALALTGLTLDAECCRQGLAQVQLAGRMQWLGNWCLDVAHNPHAAHYVARRLAQRPCDGKRYALLGMLADKDAAGVVGELAGQIDAWVTASLDGERARSAAALADTLKASGQPVVHRAESVAAAVAWLSERLGADDQVLVCGSFFTVAEALAEVQARQLPPLAEDASIWHEEGSA